MIELLKKHSGKELNFSSIYYITNNLQRAEQVTQEIAVEMREKGIKSIIPPLAMPYRLAFLAIADNIIHGRYGASEITEYNDDWIRFKIYQYSVDTVKPVSGEQSYLHTNRRHNIVSDFDAFIAAVINNVKWEDAAKVKAPKGEPSEMFIKVFEKYMKESGEYKGERFFSALAAYKQLYEFLKVNKPQNFKKTLLVEDAGDMEPVFAESLNMLEKHGVKVYKVPEPSAPGKIEKKFINFMNPLDEAEVVGFRVKQLLAKGVSGHEIAVIPYNSVSENLIELVFHRFGIKSSRINVTGNSPLFELFESAVYFNRYRDEHAESLLVFLKSPYSVFRVSAGALAVVEREIITQGYLARRDPLETIKNAVKKTLKKFKQKLSEEVIKDKAKQAMEKNVKILETITAFAETKEEKSAAQILEEVVDKKSKYNKDVLNILSESAILMDYSLKSVKDENDRRFMLDSLFAAAGDHEYFEQADPAIEARKYLNELNAYEGGAFFVPVMDALSADNIRAKHIFVFGLTSSFDRPEIIRYPGFLAKILKMPGQEKRKALKYKKLMNVINRAENIQVSYAYLNLDGKTEGMSNIARMIIDEKTRTMYPGLKDFKIITNEDNSLVRSDDIIISEKQAPDLSYAYVPDAKAKKFGSADMRDPVLEKTFIKDIIQDREGGGKKVRVTDFVKFIQCPRRFVFTLLARRTGLLPVDADSRARMDRGTFWHRVFEIAGSDFIKDFNSGKTGIKKALLNGLDRVLAEPGNDPAKFAENSKDDFIKEAKNHIIPMFADMEAERRTRFPELQVISCERELSIELKKGLVLEGKVDRVDHYKEGIIFWDYKTGGKNPEKMQYIMPKKQVFKSGYQGSLAIQLAVYIYMAEKKKPEGVDRGNKLGGIIGLKGVDNIEDMEKLVSDCGAAAEKIEEALKVFSDDFIEKNIMEIESSDSRESVFCDTADCTYCDFAPICTVLELKGLKNDKENY